MHSTSSTIQFLVAVLHGIVLLSASPLTTVAAFASTSYSPRKSNNQRAVSLTSLSSSAASTTDNNYSAKPIDGKYWPDRFPAKDHCSRCGLCETSFVSHVTDSCAFVGDGMSRMDPLEAQVHGRQRKSLVQQQQEGNDDEARFGVLAEPIQLVKGRGVEGGQWTGTVTSIALSMLEGGQVDAVVCIANSDSDDGDDVWCNPQPIIAKTPEDVLKGRGVKPALAPSLAVLDEIQADPTIRKLLFCGVGCAVQAFRSVQNLLDLDEVYVLGTNCVDNSPTPEAAKRFIQEGLKIDDASNNADDDTTTVVKGYEFMQDFQVHVKLETQKKGDDATTTTTDYITKPYFSLPGTIAAPSIATSCLACFDYTNGLADVVIGYMGAPLEAGQSMEDSYNTLSIRNSRGQHMVQTALKANRIELGGVATTDGKGGHESLALSTLQSDSIVMEMIGKGDDIPTQGMPVWLGKVLATVITNFVSPKGLDFAKYSIDYHILRNYLHVRKEWGEKRAQRTMPQAARDIVAKYVQDTDNNAMKDLVEAIDRQARK